MTEEHDVSRRNAFASILLGLGTAASLTGCLAPPGSDRAPAESDENLGRSAQALNSVDVYNVKDYGAVGDGVTDDTTAIQTALNAAGGASGFRQVFFPRGTYRVTSSLVPPTTCRLFGEDRATCVLRAGGNIDILDIRTSFDLYIERLGFNDSGGLQTTKGAIHLNNTLADQQRWFIRDCLFDGVWNGLYNDNTNSHATFGGRVRDCLFATKGPAITLYYTTNVILVDVESDHANVTQSTSVLRDIWFYGTSTLGGGLLLERVSSRAASQFGIVIENQLQVWADHIVGDVAGSGSLANSPCGILIQNTSQVHVQKAYAANAPYDNMRILGCTDVTLSQCQFAASSNGHGLKIGKNGAAISERINVLDCIAYDNVQKQIYVTDTGHATFVGNTCREKASGGSTGGIYITNCNNVSFASNVLMGTSTVLANNYGLEVNNSLLIATTGNSVRGFTRGIIETGTANYNTMFSNVAGANGGTNGGVVPIGANTIPTAANVASFNIIN